MDFIIKQASTLSPEEKLARGIVGIPDVWPVEMYQFAGDVPDGFSQISAADLEALTSSNQAAYDEWLRTTRPRVFSYTKSPVSVERLTSEIQNSDISVALNHISVFGDNLDVYFKDDLDPADIATLDALVAAHTGEPMGSELNRTTVVMNQSGNYAPAPADFVVGTSIPAVDADNKMLTRGPILTDEGSFRDDFVGESLFHDLSGSYSFSDRSDQVVTYDGDVSEIRSLYPYIKLSSDPDAALTQGEVKKVREVNLFEAYKGSTGTGAATVSNWIPAAAGGGSVSVVSSFLHLTTGGEGSSAKVCKSLDYLPLLMKFKMVIDHRTAGQETKIGLINDEESVYCILIINGTDPSKAVFRTSSGPNANDIEETTFSLPLAKTTVSSHIYAIELVSGQASLLVDDIPAVIHKDHVPNNYDSLTMHLGIEAGSSSSVTTCLIDWVSVQSVNQIDVTNSFDTVPLSVVLASPKALDGKPFVAVTARPIGTYTYLCSFGDSQVNQSKISGGENMTFSHLIGDAASAAKYFDINAAANETHIHTAYLQWQDAKLDVVSCQIVPKTTAYTAGTNTYFAINSGIIVMAPGTGNINIDLPNANLVEMTPNEYGVMPAGFWDATYNTSTKLFENITFNATGKGKYNIFAVEFPLSAFIPAFTILGSDSYEIKSNDVSQIGHNTRIKVIVNTEGADHNWIFTAAVYLFRKKSV